MNRQAFTITLLIWLFSQQLLAASWILPDADRGCVKHNQSNCEISAEKKMGHIMPMLKNGESSVTHDQSMLECDLCIVACQSLLILDNSVFFTNANHSVLITSHINPPIEHFFGTAYRPPIFS